MEADALTLEFTTAAEPSPNVKKRLRESKASRNMTLMVIWTIALYIFGALPRNIYIIVKYSLASSSRFYTFSLITFLILIFSHGVTIFIYYSHNKMFRKILIEYVKWFFCSNKFKKR